MVQAELLVLHLMYVSKTKKQTRSVWRSPKKVSVCVCIYYNENFINYKTANLTTFLKEINELRKN